MSETPILRGSCLCGGVRYEIHQALRHVLMCHCSLCRKAQGVAFRVRASVKRANFKFLCGEDLLSAFASSEREQRTFCRTCGSPLVTRFDDYPDVLGFALGTLDDDPLALPEKHVFTASKAPWDEIGDDLPQRLAGS